MSVREIMPEMAPLLEKSSISADDVIKFRRAVFHDGIVSRAEAESLFEVNDGIKKAAPQWDEFFVEAQTDYLVHQAEPHGYISEENGHWLVDMISSDGQVKTTSELELLVKALEKARSSPDFLSAFALDQVRRSVLDGTGPYSRAGHAMPGVVTEGDVAIMRRILYAFGGDGNLAITRPEAEILFELNDATLRAANDASWRDLFVKANANYLMAHTLFQAPDRAVAQRREAWLESRDGAGSLLKSMFGTMFKGDIGSVRDAYKQGDLWAERNAAFTEGEANAERITSNEVSWLTERIGRDGVLHANEKALLDFIREESPHIDASLQELLEKADLAA